VAERGAIELHRFYLDKRTHGSGLATRLMQASREAALELGGRHLWLGVWERNPRALAFYRKAGFSDVGNTIYRVGPDPQTDRVLLAQVAAT
jgi:GNAT superfamily N-acetyltransferase